MSLKMYSTFQFQTFRYQSSCLHQCSYIILMKNNDGATTCDIVYPYGLYMDIVFTNEVEKYLCI